MTCVVCNPSAFAQPLALPKGGRAFGYTCGHEPFLHVRELYYHGAEFVFWDNPTKENVLQRPQVKRLLRMMCKADVLILSEPNDLGTRQATQDATITEFERMGIRINILTGNTA